MKNKAANSLTNIDACMTLHVHNCTCILYRVSRKDLLKIKFLTLIMKFKFFFLNFVKIFVY